MISFGYETPCDECGKDLTGRQRKYCGAACKMRAYRREKCSQPAEKVCRLCGANFRPRRGKQTVCDFVDEASPECCALQHELEQQREQRIRDVDAHNDALCLHCGEWVEWDGKGRPRKFCCPAHRTAYHRAAKRAQQA